MNAVLRHLTILVTLALVIAVAAGTAEGAVAATPAPDTATAKSSSTSSAKKPVKGDQLSASERRAAESSFERESLDQAAFDSGTKEVEQKRSGGGSIMRGLLGLAVVIGLIFGVQWLLKKWAKAKVDGVNSSAGLIDVVATTGLSAGRTLHLVRVADELVLVGATEHSITRLGDFDARQLVGDSADANSTFALPSTTRRALTAGSGAAPANDFHGMLEGSIVGSVAVAAAAPADAAVGGSFVSRFLHNLRLQTAR